MTKVAKLKGILVKNRVECAFCKHKIEIKMRQFNHKRHKHLLETRCIKGELKFPKINLGEFSSRIVPSDRQLFKLFVVG